MKTWFKKIRIWSLQWANTKWGPWALFLVAFLDASILGLPTPMLFLGLALIDVKKAYKYASIGVLGTFLGAMAGYLIGHFAWLNAEGGFTGVAQFFFNNIPGFSEAGEQIRSEIISAGEATDQHFEVQEREATDQVFNPQKEHEEELSQRSDGASRDIEKIGSKHVTTEAAQSKLDSSRSAAEQGKEAVDKVKQEQSDDRDQGEKDRDDQKTRLKGTKVTFNA